MSNKQYLSIIQNLDSGAIHLHEPWDSESICGIFDELDQESKVLNYRITIEEFLISVVPRNADVVKRRKFCGKCMGRLFGDTL